LLLGGVPFLLGDLVEALAGEFCALVGVLLGVILGVAAFANDEAGFLAANHQANAISVYVS
jgi:type III secretory pathway component EscT